MSELPIYKLVLKDSDAGVDMVSFVDAPAIEQDFFAFSKQEKFKVDPKRRIVTGAMMLPDTPIYRNDGGEEFMVVFDKMTIEKVALKFFKQGHSNNVNTDHSEIVDGVYLFESFITDKSRGIQPPKGYPKVPDGSWFGSYKVENAEVWNKVLDGSFKGFSIEGVFEKELQTMRKASEMDILFKEL